MKGHTSFPKPGTCLNLKNAAVHHKFFRTTECRLQKFLSEDVFQKQKFKKL